MLQPTLPLSVVPVTSQLDAARQVPDIPPVAPVQPSSTETTIDLRNHDAEHSALLLREEQQRHHEQQKRREQSSDEPEHLAVPGHSLNADNTVPVVPLMDEAPRQGMWVDVEV
ncbi:aspartate-semialdehyde dehydrogenase [Pseudomonas sp. G.S.17]|uniref:aspartate-semialdehyde dehydrogenase n=1 Tax=Pseudomonas sp. G.S.17 TaxID=3137451 RepID=UPI00311CAF11